MIDLLKMVQVLFDLYFAPTIRCGSKIWSVRKSGRLIPLEFSGFVRSCRKRVKPNGYFHSELRSFIIMAFFASVVNISHEDMSAHTVPLSPKQKQKNFVRCCREMRLV